MSKWSLQVIAFLGSFASVVVFWRNTQILLGMLFLLAGLVNYSTDWLMIRGFIFCALTGSFAEMICIHFGVWRYNDPQFFGVPLWLPLLWGISSVFFASIHKHLAQKAISNK